MHVANELADKIVDVIPDMEDARTILIALGMIATAVLQRLDRKTATRLLDVFCEMVRAGVEEAPKH